MRRPDVAVTTVSHSSASVPLALSSRSNRRMNLSTGSLAPSSSVANIGGWSLPSFNHFMTLPRRFMPPSFSASTGNNVSRSLDTGSGNVVAAMIRRSRSGASNSTAMESLPHEENAEYGTLDHFMLPPIVHFQGARDADDAVPDPVHHQEEIDLTFSSEEDEDGGQDATDSSDVIEILDTAESPGISMPFCRKRRRSRINGDNLVSKHQRITDMMKSAESTSINMQNSEVVEEFKRRLKCSICLDVLEDMTSTLCGHIFCAGCIHEAIRANGKCPLCQRRLHVKDTHRLYF
ncbi:putative Zinc finger, RING-type [Plasmopara halstedii]